MAKKASKKKLVRLLKGITGIGKNTLKLETEFQATSNKHANLKPSGNHGYIQQTNPKKITTQIGNAATLIKSSVYGVLSFFTIINAMNSFKEWKKLRREKNGPNKSELEKEHLKRLTTRQGWKTVNDVCIAVLALTTFAFTLAAMFTPLGWTALVVGFSFSIAGSICSMIKVGFERWKRKKDSKDRIAIIEGDVQSKMSNKEKTNFLNVKNHQAKVEYIAKMMIEQGYTEKRVKDYLINNRELGIGNTHYNNIVDAVSILASGALFVGRFAIPVVTLAGLGLYALGFVGVSIASFFPSIKDSSFANGARRWMNKASRYLRGKKNDPTSEITDKNIDDYYKEINNMSKDQIVKEHGKNEIYRYDETKSDNVSPSAKTSVFQRVKKLLQRRKSSSKISSSNVKKTKNFSSTLKNSNRSRSKSTPSVRRRHPFFKTATKHPEPSSKSVHATSTR